MIRKKVLAVLLALAVIFSMVPTAFAADSDTYLLKFKAVSAEVTKEDGTTIKSQTETQKNFDSLDDLFEFLAKGTYTKTIKGTELTYTIDTSVAYDIEICSTSAVTASISKKVIIQTDSNDTESNTESYVICNSAGVTISAMNSYYYNPQHTLTFSNGIEVGSGAKLTLDNNTENSKGITVQYTFEDDAVVSGTLTFSGNAAELGSGGTDGSVTFSGNATLTVAEGGEVTIGSVAVTSASESSEDPLITVESGGTLNFTTDGVSSYGTITTSGTAITVEEGGELTVSAGKVTSTSDDPAIVVESGGSITITEDSSLMYDVQAPDITTASTDGQAVSLESGSTITAASGVTVTVSEENDEAGDNYVDNYGNIILAANPSEDGEGTVNAAKIILADGTTIEGTEENSLQITYEDDEETDETVTQVTVPAGGSVQKPDEAKTTLAAGGSVSSTGGEPKVEETTISATGITLDKSSVTLYSNTTPNTVTLTATLTPEDSTDAVEWVSSDTSVATVDANGNVTAVANGTATITATAGSCSANCTVTVKTYSSGGGGSSSSTYTVTVDSAKNGAVTVSPKNASKGTTVTITVTPDSGYELDDLTVTDKNGDTVKLTRKSDTQYTFTMPAGKVTVEASFTKVEEPPSVTFIDVPTSAYYYEAVEWAVENDITKGTSATTFSPDATCTRAQMVTFLWRAAGSPAPESSVNPFEDVKSGEYYYDAVLWAVEKGITEGTSATTFSPDDTVTRGQTVAFLYRATGSPASSGGGFTDVAADAYYAPAVQWAVANGITNGTSSTTFSPDAPCTRGQIVTFLYRDMAE